MPTWVAVPHAFPEGGSEPSPVITNVDRLICAGASASYLPQAVHFVEHFSGPVIASQCAKSMLIDVSQTTQTPYLPLLVEQQHADALVQRAQHWLQNNMAKQFGLTQLAEQLAVSERTLIRRFSAALGQSPLTYLQHLRIDTARALLESGNLGVESIAAHVGYTDASSFSRLFTERVGLSPGKYRSRFLSEASTRV